MPQTVHAILAQRIREEIGLGFPLLGKVPQTSVIQLIDYIASLDAAAREAIVDALAARAEARLTFNGGTESQPDAWERFYNITRGPGPFSGGMRYCDIRFIAQVPRFPHFGGIEAWNRQYSGLATTPRADLLPDPAAFIPAKAPLLKRLVKSALTPLGYVAHKSVGGGLRYLSPDGTLVDFDFGARLAQLRYGVAIHAADKVTAPLSRVRFMSLEEIFGSAEGAWDYLTEENAARCVAHLPALIGQAAIAMASVPGGGQR